MAKLDLPNKTIVPRLIDRDLDYLSRLIYNPLTGIVYRRRLEMAVDAIASVGGPYERILEVGYGPGLMLPSLAQFTANVEGVDIHTEGDTVQKMLNDAGLHGTPLKEGSVLDLPYEDATFSHVVCVSVLEHLRELDRACAELTRVTKPGGWIVLGMPVKSPITAALFRVLGYDDDEIHPSSHRAISEAAARALEPRETRRFPPIGVDDLSLYLVKAYRKA